MAIRQPPVATSLAGLVSLIASYQWPYVLLGGLAFLTPSPVRECVVAVSLLVLSTGIHEFGHAVGYQLVAQQRPRTRLHVFLGIALSVDFDPPCVSRYVALAGPLLPTLFAVALALLGASTHNSWLGLAAGVFSLHVLGLIPGSSDGDHLWNLISPSNSGE